LLFEKIFGNLLQPLVTFCNLLVSRLTLLAYLLWCNQIVLGLGPAFICFYLLKVTETGFYLVFFRKIGVCFVSD